MKILIDLRALTTDTTSGVTVYLRSVLTELLKLDKQNTYYLWWNSRDKSKQPPVFQAPRVKIIQTHYSNRFLNLRLRSRRLALDQLILEAAGEPTEKLDLFWLPDPRPVHLSSDCALVATIHDLAAETYPEFFNLKTRIWHRFLHTRAIAKKADQLLTVSHFTASEIQSKWGIRTKKITITPLGASVNPKETPSKSTLEKIRAKYQLPKKFVLSLSTLEPRKNLATLVQAFAGLKAETDLPHHLVLAGEINSSIFANPKIKSAPWLHLPGFIAEEDKAALLQSADCFCFPSYYEGFGLPALDALTVGIPLLAADIPALREIAGAAALYAPPDNPDAWTIALRKVLTDQKLNQKLSEAGTKQAQKYNWTQTATATLRIFGKVTENRKKFVIQ